MITFKGSQKAFFKAYPKDKRSLDEVYCLVSYNIITKQETKTCYQFIGSLGEKNFKKVETPKDITETVAVDTKNTNDTNVSDVQNEDDLDFANPDGDVVEEKKCDVKAKAEEATEVSEVKAEEKTEVVKEEKSKKKTVAVKREELLEAFQALTGFMGCQIDNYNPVDMFALQCVCNEFNTCDFSTEAVVYVDLFKYFLNKYPTLAKYIQTCIDVIEDVYNDIVKNKQALVEEARWFYGDCGLTKEQNKKKRKRKQL